jgi:FMN phosphatase YigB (HAD superfamily)
MIKNIVFDLDGTLYKTESAAPKIKEYYSKRFGIPIPQLEEEWELARAKVMNSTKTFNYFKEFYDELERITLASLGVRSEQIRSALKYKENVIIENEKYNIQPLPGLREFLEWCRTKKIKLYVLSGGHTTENPRVNVKNIELEKERQVKHKQIRNLGLTHYFDDIIPSMRYGAFKPDIKVFEGFLKEKNVKPETCIFIGDTWPDMEAKKTGMKTILKNPKNKEYPSDKERPDFTAQNYEQVMKRVKNLVQT